MKKDKAIRKKQLGYWLYGKTTIPISVREKFSQLPMFCHVIFFESEVLGFHCSPYSATILLSNPHQGKLTIKSDLIFEEYSMALALLLTLFMLALNSRLNEFILYHHSCSWY
jgi:hypothetical protein